MALKKITEVDIIQGSSLTDSANYYVEQNGSFYRVSKADLKSSLLGNIESDIETLQEDTDDLKEGLRSLSARLSALGV